MTKPHFIIGKKHGITKEEAVEDEEYNRLGE